MMHVTQQKEQFSLAFIRAVASVAGYGSCKPEVDDDSVDLSIRGNRRDGAKQRAPTLDIQAKCIETDDGSGDHLAYPLKLKNYEDLRIVEAHTPAILVVVTVPKEVDHWIDDSPEQMALRRCAYWLSLRGAAATSNEHTCTVHLPRMQRFTVHALREIMTRIGNGGRP